ncbi:MAG: DUF4336 domain-containing protein [Leptolyngbyaceae cyanobacterium bins.59]|nr:DUF4336 domain-containing protein [Leptolyngbyaceae cyanobacterium bins.59]
MDRTSLQTSTIQDLTDASWPFWPLVPLYPYGTRRTLRREVVQDTIWTFDQIQGIFYVVVPIRMTVVRLEAGGLLVYAPIAPTPECLRLMQDLVAVHGDVKYILLPTVSGLEHKVFVGPFARQFPRAQVFVAPNQWSYPVNLPLSWLGLPRKRTQFLPEDPHQVPFADEFDYALLGPIKLGLGPFSEVALCHRPSRSLLVTDSVISIPPDPPAIVQLDPYPLLFHARDTALDNLPDTAANRRKGWERICLFTLYFQPGTLKTPALGEALREARQSPDRSRKAYFGLYPFRWQSTWHQSFEAVHQEGRLWVAPVLQTLILNRAPRETLKWADRIAQWQFERVIPCHFDAPVTASPQQFRQAFSFLEDRPLDASALPEVDLRFMKELEQLLDKFRITPPAQAKVRLS